MNKSKLYDLIDEYWDDYNNKKGLDGVIKGSIPIIWFGDMESYFKSKIKTVTVSLNPSCHEFMIDNSQYDFVYRFKETKSFNNKKHLDKDEKDKLIAMYNEYFKVHPYDFWFKEYEKIMGYLSGNKGYDVGYNMIGYESHENTAIHIDCLSAIATDPTWSKLKENAKYKTTVSNLPNYELFVKFLLFLDPDVILFSSAYDYFYDCMKIYVNKLDPKLDIENVLVPDVSQVKNYPIRKGLINSFRIKNKRVIHGRYKFTPFTPIGSDVKEKAFQEILQTYKDWFEEIKKRNY